MLPDSPNENGYGLLDDSCPDYYYMVLIEVFKRLWFDGDGGLNNSIFIRDLCETLPDVKSFSVTNLKYMKYFYQLYSDNGNRQQVVDDSEYDFIFRIPWGHHIAIINKCGDNRDKALFFIRETLENNWSRAVLLNFLDTDLYTRNGNAVTNFSLTLPKNESELAQAITKDPYNFDFLTLTENYNEKELKDALMNNITKFLLELGNEFAFVGREVRLEVGETENFIDMLFYNIKLHCYVVIEVKTEEFDSRDQSLKSVSLLMSHASQENRTKKIL